MESICKNCIFYTPESNFTESQYNDKFGECNKISDTLNDDSLLVVLNGGGYDSTIVGKNFGCIHFKSET